MNFHFPDPGLVSRSYAAPAGVDSALPQGRHRVFLVAFRHDRLPPAAYGANLLERMRVVRVEPNKHLGHNAIRVQAHAGLEVVPLGTDGPSPAADNVVQIRSVQGEILRDEEGRLYEKSGGTIRPLHKVFSSPQGQIVEVAPLAPASVPRRNRVEHPATPRNVPRHTCRKLFADPGELRVVTWGDFKHLLAAQLVHPDRLGDAHQLRCYVQVYESSVPQRLEALAAALLGDPRCAAELHALTDSVAAKLELAPLLPQRPAMRRPPRRGAGMVLPFDRLFRLQVAHDPTQEGGPGPGQEKGASPPPAAPLSRQGASAGSPQVATPPPAPDSKGSLRDSGVPQRFLKPGEFQLTREEVVYDMNSPRTIGEWLLSSLRWLSGRRAERNAFRKWQVLLCGKTLEEQLWTVHPPRGGLAHPKVREWARRTLGLAGYDPGAMLLEWEIFWRRKGL